ncbi:MAG: Transcriptional regulator, MarR family [Acidobacteria bacterium]|nr:Transcriptional regulator, MarR family [Acidobacteriota bacterium]
MDDALVFEVQRLYPQLYLACHVDHVRASSTEFQLSSYDASILAHLDVNDPATPRSLAAHLGVVASTLSAALTRLAKLGYLTNSAAATDKRRRELRLTTRGAEAMASTSVLDSARVRKMLASLSAHEREDAVRGLALLARAARQMKEQP